MEVPSSPAAPPAVGSAGSASPSASTHDTLRLSSWTTLLALFLVLLIFFRSVLPRLPRLVLRGRLRVRRVGIRGIQGLEWRSRGFAPPSRHTAYGGGGGADDDQGLVVRIQHIYPVFRSWNTTAAFGDDESGEADATQEAGPSAAIGPGQASGAEGADVRPGQTRGASIPAAARRRSRQGGAWLTICIQGVGVRVPAKPQHAQGRIGDEGDGLDVDPGNGNQTSSRGEAPPSMSEAQRQQELYEERLRYLLRSESPHPPSHADGEPHPAMLRRGSLVEEAGAWLPSPGHGWLIGAFIKAAYIARCTATRAARRSVVISARTVLYFIVSALPALTSLVDVELHRAEIYVEEADAVVRLAKVRAGLNMALVQVRSMASRGGRSSGEAAFRFQGGSDGEVEDMARARDPSKRSKIRGALYEMPGRLGSGARGFVSYVRSGLPGGRATFGLDVGCIQVFEASPPRTANAASSSRSRAGSLSSPRRASRAEGSPAASAGPSMMQRTFSHIASPSETSGFEPSAQWLSFGASPPPPPPLSSTRVRRGGGAGFFSDAGNDAARAGARWASNWVEWALEPFPGSSFSSDPGWHTRSRGGTGADGEARRGQQSKPTLRGDRIPESARILALPGVSRMEVGLKFGASLELGAPESIRVRVELAEAIVGADALIRTLGTLKEAKVKRESGIGDPPSSSAQASSPATTPPSQSDAPLHVPPRSQSSAAEALRALGSASISLPLIRIGCELEGDEDGIVESLPDAPDGGKCRLRATLEGFHLVLRGSKPSEAAHRNWLGSCGARNFQPSAGSSHDSSLRHGLARRFAWNPRAPPAFVEHRRAFLVEAGIEGLEASIATKSGSTVTSSKLLNMRRSWLQARSTWTPLGLLTMRAGSNSSPLFQARRHFEADPNEQVVQVNAHVGSVTGDVSLMHLLALDASLRKVRGGDSRPSDSSPAPKKTHEPMRRQVQPARYHAAPPKLFGGLSVGATSYRIRVAEADDAAAAGGPYHFPPSATLGSGLPRSPMGGILIKLPTMRIALQGSYRDLPITRPEVERRAAWRALAKDELEWSLAEDLRSAAPGVASPRKVSGEFRGLVQERRRREQVQTNKGHQQSLSIDEALRKMRDQYGGGGGEESNVPEGGQSQPPLTPVVESPGSAAKETAESGQDAPRRVAPNIAWSFEGRLETDVLELLILSDAPASAAAASPPQTYRLFSLEAVSMDASGSVQGVQDPSTDGVRLDPDSLRVQAGVSLEEIGLHLWHPECLGTLRTGMEALWTALAAHRREADSLASGRQRASTAEHSRSPLDRLRLDASLFISVGTVLAHLGGSDPSCDPHIPRGVAFEAKRICFEAASVHTASRRAAEGSNDPGWGSRSALQLPEDLSVSAVSLALRHGRAAMCRISLFEIGLFPLLDAEAQMEDHDDAQEDGEGAESPSVLADAVWDFERQPPSRLSFRRRTLPKFKQQDRTRFIFWMPFSATKVTLLPPDATRSGKALEEISVETQGTRLLAFKMELLHTYCMLMAFASLRSLLPKNAPTKNHATQPDTSGGSDRQPMPQEAASVEGEPVKDTRASKAGASSSPSFRVRAGATDVHISIALPNDVNLFAHIRHLELRATPNTGVQLGSDYLIAAVERRSLPGDEVWEEALRLRDWRVSVKQRPKPTPDGGPPIEVLFAADAVSARVPFNYKVFPIIDNASLAFKATKQLVHQFVHSGTDSVIVPVPEGPKRLPPIRVELRTLAFEAQDDPFETRLNIIWRAGGDENQARIERDFAFSERLATSRLGTQARSSASLAQSMASTMDDAAATATTATTSALGHDDSPDSDSDSGSPSAPSLQQARERLDAFNAQSWIRRHLNARAEQVRREESTLRRIYGRFPMSRHHTELPIRIVTPQRASPLFRSSMSRVLLEIGAPSFPMEDLRDFIAREGRGVPKNTPYDLLIPMHMRWRMAEWRIDLRDYPIPLLHVPPVDRNQADEGKWAWNFQMDLVLAEQCGGIESIRHAPAVVVPAASGRPHASEYGINVPKMAMPVKFYGSPVVRIATPHPTRFAWGHSMQPAIHDMVRVFDGMSSPPHDPSPKIGFWDKLPLLLHGKLHILFENDFHLYLKGSRDPYHILGHGSGWVKCLRGNVELRLGFENDDNEVIQFIADEYLLAIPDLHDYIDRAATGITSDKASSNSSVHGAEDAAERRSNPASLVPGRHYAREPSFRKVCVRLTHGVRWGFGLRFEHACTPRTCKRRPKCSGSPFYRECRFFDFRKHWEVTTRTKEYVATLPEEEKRDSYEGWRSDHIHFSLSVCSPQRRSGRLSFAPQNDGSDDEVTNNFYLSPLAWENFWAWMRLFNSAMSLPIRQGRLFPADEPESPKFGRYLATVKYRFDIAPLFITHLYPQSLRSDYSAGASTSLGIKTRMDLFHLDFHQRQQEMLKEGPDGQMKRIFHKPFYEAELDLKRIDLRVLAGQFREPNKSLVPGSDLDDDGGPHDDMFAGECKLAERDVAWWDIKDFVEVDWTPPEDTPPKLKLVQALECPRFNYYRRIESQRERRQRQDSHDGNNDRDNVFQSTSSSATPDETRVEAEEEATSRLGDSKFGRESTHTCLVGRAPDAFEIQLDLANQRVACLEEQLHSAAAVDDHSLVRDLEKKLRIVASYVDRLRHMGDGECGVHANAAQPDVAASVSRRDETAQDESLPRLDVIYREWEDFDNRYFVHNPTIFLSNATRDLLLKYYHSSRRRRGAVHNLTARAVRYIRNLARRYEEEEERHEREILARSPATPPRSEPQRANLRRSGTADTTQSIHALLQGLLEDSMRANVQTEDSDARSAENSQRDLLETVGIHPEFGISEFFEVHRSNICNLIKPQIVLKSEIDERSTVILTAIRIKLYNYSVNDMEAEEDSVNERALHRNYFALEGLQAFQPSEKCRFLDRAIQRSGFVFVPLETLVDVKYETGDFDRIIGRTDALMHYDKFNKLRLNDASKPVMSPQLEGNHDADHLAHHMDLVRVRCPRMGVHADSKQFAAVYNIVTDLLLYRDPAHREHAKKLETMLFSYDFSDLGELADVVAAMQVRVRHANDLHAQYHLQFSNLTQQGKLDFLSLKLEIADMMDELSLIMEAIAAYEDSGAQGSDRDKKSALRLEASSDDITWSMMGTDEGDLLAKLSIKGVAFTWLNKADNSAANSLTIVDLNAVNVHPDALFPEIISKYNKVPDHPMARQGRFLNAVWSVLAPVGGIAIVDQFDFNLHPLRIQLELKVGRQIMDYIFGSKRERERREQEKRLIEEQRAEERGVRRGGTRGRVGGKLARLAQNLHLGRSTLGKGDSPPTPRDERHDREALVSAASRSERSLVGGVSRPNGRKSFDAHSESSSQTRLRPPSIKAGYTRPNTPQSRGEPGGDGEMAANGLDDDDAVAQVIAARDAAEMRSRAANNRTFVYVKIAETVFCLSYKGDKQKSITDLYDLVFHSPTIEYRNRTWGYVDLTNHFKRDIFRAAWGQKTSLIKGILNHRPRKLSLRQAARNAASIAQSGASPLRVVSGSGGGSGDSVTPRVMVDPPSPSQDGTDSPEQERSPHSSPAEHARVPQPRSSEPEEAASDSELEQSAIVKREEKEHADDSPHSLAAGDLHSPSSGRGVARFLSAKLSTRPGSSTRSIGAGSASSDATRRAPATPQTGRTVRLDGAASSGGSDGSNDDMSDETDDGDARQDEGRNVNGAAEDTGSDSDEEEEEEQRREEMHQLQRELLAPTEGTPKQRQGGRVAMTGLNRSPLTLRRRSDVGIEGAVKKGSTGPLRRLIVGGASAHHAEHAARGETDFREANASTKHAGE